MRKIVGDKSDILSLIPGYIYNNTVSMWIIGLVVETVLQLQRSQSPFLLGLRCGSKNMRELEIK